MSIIVAFCIGVLIGWRASPARAAYILARKNGTSAKQAYYVAALVAIGITAGAQ